MIVTIVGKASGTAATVKATTIWTFDCLVSFFPQVDEKRTCNESHLKVRVLVAGGVETASGGDSDDEHNKGKCEGRKSELFSLPAK